MASPIQLSTTRCPHCSNVGWRPQLVSIFVYPTTCTIKYLLQYTSMSGTALENFATSRTAITSPILYLNFLGFGTLHCFERPPGDLQLLAQTLQHTLGCGSPTTGPLPIPPSPPRCPIPPERCTAYPPSSGPASTGCPPRPAGIQGDPPRPVAALFQTRAAASSGVCPATAAHNIRP